MKTVKQLLDNYTITEIRNRFFEKYPDQIKSRPGYVKALRELKELKPKYVDNPMVLHCELYGCHGFVPGDDTRYGIAASWDVVLGYKVKRATLDSMCNILYEITYHGYSNEEVQSFWKDMNEHVAEINKDLDER